MYSCTSRDNLNSLRLCINRVVKFVYKLGIREHVSGHRFQLLDYDFGYDFISSRQIILFFRFKKFEFCASNRTYSINYPNFSNPSMNRSFALKVSRHWNLVIPYSDRRFSYSIKEFANIFKSNLWIFILECFIADFKTFYISHFISLFCGTLYGCTCTDILGG